jgi:hypothetical protein
LYLRVFVALARRHGYGFPLSDLEERGAHVNGGSGMGVERP